MKHLIASLIALFPALGIIGSVPVISKEDDEAVVTRVLTDYYRAFSTQYAGRAGDLPYCHGCHRPDLTLHALLSDEVRPVSCATPRP